MSKIIIQGGRLLDPETGLDEIGDLVIEDDRVLALATAAEGGAGAYSTEEDAEVLDAAGLIVTPGLIDARSVVGLAGYFNHEHDQDQLERSSPMQPELRAVDSYNTNIGTDTNHPFLSARPDRMTLSVWGVVMATAGHQIPHIHPAAWLSGVYYAKIPDIVAEDIEKRAGWIAFGSPPDHFHNRSNIKTRTIQPEPGLMVLFPSYFYHHTIPFHTDETRISIAFDLTAA